MFFLMFFFARDFVGGAGSFRFFSLTLSAAVVVSTLPRVLTTVSLAVCVFFVGRISCIIDAKLRINRELFRLETSS
jgi:hypothetical protein